MRLGNAEKRTIEHSDIIRVDRMFDCDNCGKQHSRTVRQSRYGTTIIASTNGTNQPHVMTGLKDKKFCHELCAVRYVIRQECGNGSST